MSIRIMTNVWEHSKAHSGDLLVLLAIADHASDNGCAYPSIKTLARKSRLSERQVQRAIQSLITKGELSVAQNSGRSGTNLYRVLTGGDNLSGVTPMSPKPSVFLFSDDCTLSEKSEDQTLSEIPQETTFSERTTKAKKEFEPSHDFLDENLQSEWAAFQINRKEMGKPLTALGRRRIINELNTWTHDEAIKGLSHAIEGNWLKPYKPREERRGRPALELKGKSIEELYDMLHKGREQLNLLKRRYGESAVQTGAVGRQMQSLEAAANEIRAAIKAAPITRKGIT